MNLVLIRKWLISYLRSTSISCSIIHYTKIVWRVFHPWFRFITFGGHSAYLAYFVHKCGRKIPINIFIPNGAYIKYINAPFKILGDFNVLKHDDCHKPKQTSRALHCGIPEYSHFSLKRQCSFIIMPKTNFCIPFNSASTTKSRYCWKMVFQNWKSDYNYMLIVRHCYFINDSKVWYSTL